MTVQRYVAPQTIAEAVTCLNESGHRAKVIAGGTDLIVQMRAGRVQPNILVDLRRLPLGDIRAENGFVYVGARVTHTQIIGSPHLAPYTALVASCRDIGSLPIRNRGTVGGNLANASPAADTAPPLLVYDASVVLAGQESERDLPLSQFLLGPGLTAMAPGEILKEIRLPDIAPNSAAAFIKLGKRKAMFIAVVSVAARLTVDNAGRVRQARLALGSVAPTPLRVPSAEELLCGQDLSDDALAAAAHEASRVATPISDTRASAAYRRSMVEVLARRALRQAVDALQKDGTCGHA